MGVRSIVLPCLGRFLTLVLEILLEIQFEVERVVFEVCGPLKIFPWFCCVHQKTEET